MEQLFPQLCDKMVWVSIDGEDTRVCAQVRVLQRCAQTLEWLLGVELTEPRADGGDGERDGERLFRTAQRLNSQGIRLSKSTFGCWESG